MSEEHQFYDEMEPIGLGRDVMAPEREIKFRQQPPKVLVSLDSNNPKDELFNQKTVLLVRKPT